METLKVIVLLLFIMVTVIKIILHQQLVSQKHPKFSLRWSLEVGFKCQPFIPIISGKKSSTTKVINICVVLFYALLFCLLLSTKESL